MTECLTLLTFAIVAELQKEKRKLESKGNLKEVAAVCNKIGELLSRLGMLLTFFCLFIFLMIVIDFVHK